MVNDGYFYVLFLRIAHSPFTQTNKIKIKQQQKRCKHRIRKKNRLKALCMMQIKK